MHMITLSKIALAVSALMLGSLAFGAPDEPMLSPNVAQAKKQDKGTRLILLGTAGGPILNEKRSQPSSMLVVDGRPYLIDAGEGTVVQLARAGFSSFDIQRLFLTHLHFDHTAGLSSLIAFNWISGERQHLDVFGPPGTTQVVADAVKYYEVSENIYSPQLPPHPKMKDIVTAHEVDVTLPKIIYQDDKVRVTAVENTHYSTLHMEPPSYGPVRSYSFRFETADKVVVFSGDTGPSDALRNLAQGADILVSEVIDLPRTIAILEQRFTLPADRMAAFVNHMRVEHLVPEEVGKLAAAANVRMVILTHISPGEAKERTSAPYTDGVRKYYRGPIVLGADLNEF